MRLPRKIALRLADVRRHYEALGHALERTTEEQFAAAARAADPERLLAVVYPLERAFELLCNYVAELNELGLSEAGIATADRPTSLRVLEREHVISHSRARRWRGILDARNELQHEYPDIRAGRIYEAALILAEDLPGYLRDYVAWMRELGFADNAT
jgi:uncharacterized protein YutE (UPF0331/DUF86 family)